MMRIALNLEKSLEANASEYYEKAKRAKKKLVGAREAVAKTLKIIEALKEEKEVKQEKAVLEPKRKKEWYEKFRWFFTSSGFLAVGGRDATTNEVLLKKHLAPADLVFHTDMAGSPFFVLKTETKSPDAQSMQEVADATCTFSRAWKLGLAAQQVFYVKPDQVTKEPNPGEYLTKGAFVIRGKTNYLGNKINCAIGRMDDGKIMAAPVEAVKAHCKDFFILVQGDEKPSDAAKKIRHKLGGEIDEIIRALPSGNMKILKA